MAWDARALFELKHSWFKNDRNDFDSSKELDTIILQLEISKEHSFGVSLADDLKLPITKRERGIKTENNVIRAALY